MEIKEFIQNFAEQFEDTDASVFTPDTVFHDLDEWGSLIGLSIIAMIDDEYGVTIKGDELRTAKTVADVFELVKSKK
ncbi:MAG: acyl carrier protein [Bacteroidaceae bacterium]|nr:acyl carrier protein [Bacteroidaceae bacterium]